MSPGFFVTTFSRIVSVLTSRKGPEKVAEKGPYHSADLELQWGMPASTSLCRRSGLGARPPFTVCVPRDVTARPLLRHFHLDTCKVDADVVYLEG